jgi:hypothetical protein
LKSHQIADFQQGRALFKPALPFWSNQIDHIDTLGDAVRMATTSGLTRPQLSSDLGVGLSTLNKWVQQHQHNDLMSGPHEDV